MKPTKDWENCAHQSNHLLLLKLDPRVPKPSPILRAMQASLEDNITGFDSPRMKTHIQTTEKGNEDPVAKKLKKVQEKR